MRPGKPEPIVLPFCTAFCFLHKKFFSLIPVLLRAGMQMRADIQPWSLRISVPIPRLRVEMQQEPTEKDFRRYQMKEVVGFGMFDSHENKISEHDKRFAQQSTDLTNEVQDLRQHRRMASMIACVVSPFRAPNTEQNMTERPSPETKLRIVAIRSTMRRSGSDLPPEHEDWTDVPDPAWWG